MKKPIRVVNYREEVVNLGGQNVLCFVVNLSAFAMEEDIIFILLDGKPAYHLHQKEILSLLTKFIHSTDTFEKSARRKAVTVSTRKTCKHVREPGRISQYFQHKDP